MQLSVADHVLREATHLLSALHDAPRRWSRCSACPAAPLREKYGHRWKP
ncbi:hypothetical protein ACFWZT_36925 [Streptomyces alboflavus]